MDRDPSHICAVVVCVMAALLSACGSSRDTSPDDDDGVGGATSAASATNSSVDVGVGPGSGGQGCGTSFGSELSEVGDNPEVVQIEADGTHVFWSDTYGLHRSLPDGSEQTALVADFPFNTDDLLVTAQGVYLTGYSGVSKYDKDGNALGSISTLMSVGTVAEDGATVFFTRANEGAIYTAPSEPSNGGVVLAGTADVAPHAGGIMARDGYVYWSSGSVLYRAPQSGGSYEVLSQDASPKVWNGSVALTSELIVWVGQQGVYAAPIAGGAPVVVSSTAPSNWRIAVDDQAVYFAGGNAVWRAELAGGGPVMLDCFGDVATGDVAVDANNVYWLAAETADGPGDFNVYSLRATPKQPR